MSPVFKQILLPLLSASMKPTLMMAAQYPLKCQDNSTLNNTLEILWKKTVVA
jgi:hypothetical protein